MSVRRDTLVSIAFAVWGLAIAIALIVVWNRPAPAGQAVGLAQAQNFDAHGPFRWIGGLMLLPILVPLALRPITRRLAEGRKWARHAVVAGSAVTLWLVTVRQSVAWTVVPFAILIAICTLLRARDLRFTRRDAVLVPVFLTTLMGVLDVTRLPSDAAAYVAALLVFALRVAVALIDRPLAPALAFIAAPLGLVLQTGFFARDERYFGWHALALVVVTPFVLRVVQRDARRAIAILTFVIYPLALYSYSNAMSTATAEGKGRVNFFEDGHSLLPASEYLRGELPYRDILPAHGLVEDGFFDYVAMRVAGVNVGARMKARAVIGDLACIALYFIALGATGSAEGALFAVLLGFLTGAYRGAVRLLPALVTLAFLVAGVRLRWWRLFAYAGFGSVICGLVSLDFAAYTFVTLVVAVVRERRAFRPAAIGIAAGVVPLVVVLAAFGILDDFVRGTFVETLSLGPAYTLHFFAPTEAMARRHAFPDILVELLDRETFAYLFWCAVAIFVGVTIARRASRRLEPAVLLGVWTVVAAISYAERHHLYFNVIAPVLVVFAILRLLRRSRAVAAMAIAATIAMSIPTVHLGILAWMRKSRGPIEPGWVQIDRLPRARGALFHEPDAKVIDSVGRYLALSLAPDETFLDFTNSGILYFLFRRDCPIREYEVAFYQSEKAQREVIRRIESNPKVRAVLMPPHPRARFAIDGIPNADRAPLVWQYIQTHFHPDFEEGDVVFWRRR